MKRLLLVLVAALALVATSCGSNGATGESSAAAVVNGTSISMEQLTEEMEQLAFALFGPSDEMTADQWASVHGEKMPVTNFTSEFTTGAMQSLVSSQMIADELAERDLSVSDDEVAVARSQLEQQIAQQNQQAAAQGQSIMDVPPAYLDTLARRSAEQAALSQALAAETAPIEVTDEDVRAEYDANIDQLVEQNGDFACLSLIVIGWTEDQDPEAAITTPTAEQEADSLARAQAIVDDLNSGADFAQVAAEKSAVPSTAESGGNYGCLAETSESGIPEVQQAAFAQPVGQVGDPVRTDYGYVIVKVRSRGVPPFEDVESAIRSQLEQQAQQQTDPLEAWRAAALADESLDVWINPQIGTWEVVEQQDPTTGQVTNMGQIVPPEGAATQTTLGPEGGLGDPIDLSQLTTGG